MEHTANGQQAEFFVVLADQADLSGAANLQTKAEKGRFVFQTLFNKAQTTQGPVLQWLRERGLEHRSFYIVNAILVKGTREVAEALAARPDVARVEGNPRIDNHLPQPDSFVRRPFKLAAAGDDRTGRQLHARAAGMGARVHRTGNCCRRCGHRPALDT